MTTIESQHMTGIDLTVRDLGRMPYAEAFALQKRLQQEVIEGRARGASLGHLVLVEHHPPVITISRRKTARRHLVATDEQLTDAGVEIAQTDRGGDITYHGPGQLVVYPILDLNALRLRIHGYMRFLEQIVIDTLAEFGIQGQRDKCATGVWVGGESIEESHGLLSVGVGKPQKICAMGVRVSRWVSMHGLALNVTTNLDHFDLIVPCGLAGRTVTSMQRELGDACPTMDDVKRAILAQFRKAINGPTT
jgi:lipoyl(octanoyl) transferase